MSFARYIERVCFKIWRHRLATGWERLRGDRSGQHSIRVKDQWRICLVYADGAAERVEIVDYHRD